jgi:hypothetical protein
VAVSPLGSDTRHVLPLRRKEKFPFSRWYLVDYTASIPEDCSVNTGTTFIRVATDWTIEESHCNSRQKVDVVYSL